MLEFLTLKPEAFGLDFSDLSLKIVNLEKKWGKFRLVSFGETPIKPGVIKNGEIKDKKSLVGIIKKAISGIKGKKLKTKYLIASLPEEKAFLQVIQMPFLSKEDLKSAVIYEAENYIPLPIEEVYLDSQVVPPVYNHLDHQDVLITALPRKTVDPYVDCLRQSSLKPLALEIESLAITRALIKGESTTLPILIIDFKRTKTSFIIFSGNSLRFTFSIPVSSQSFTEAISRVMKIDLKKAEGLKLKYGLEARKTKEGSQVFDALIPPLIDLIEQIKKYLEYYHTHAAHEHLPPNGKKVEKVFLCGEEANFKGLIDFFSSQLELPIEFGNPWINILTEGQKKVSELPPEKSLSFTSALGLALRAMKDKR